MFHHYFLSLRKKKEDEISSPTTTALSSSPSAASTTSSLTASLSSLSSSLVRRQINSSSSHIIERKNSILNFFSKIDAQRDFVKDPFRPVNIKSPELIYCEQEILDSHRAAAETQNKRKLESLAITENSVTPRILYTRVRLWCSGYPDI